MTWFFQRGLIQFLMFIGLSAAVGWNLAIRMEQVDLTIWKSSSKLDWACMGVALLLVPVNWVLETLKFRTLLSGTTDLRFARLFQSILGGISVSMLLPNRMGEFIGRLVFFPAGQRSAALTATWTGSALQSVWILVFGGWVLVNSTEKKEVIQYMTLGMSWPFIAVVGLSTGMFILWGWSRIKPYLQAIRVHFMNILGNGAVTAAGAWALLRYVTYSIQFVLLLRFTGVAAPWMELLAYVSLVFLFQTILPFPPALGWISRIELAVFIGGFLLVPPVEAAIASLLLWTMNLALPGLYGGYILLNQHLYKHLDHVRTAFTPD